jgi:hypothetical protein
LSYSSVTSWMTQSAVIGVPIWSAAALIEWMTDQKEEGSELRSVTVGRP